MPPTPPSPAIQTLRARQVQPASRAGQLTESPQDRCDGGNGARHQPGSRDIRVFREGLNAGDLDAFLADGDIYLGRWDLFVGAHLEQAAPDFQRKEVQSVHFDAFRNRLKHTWRPGGHKNPMQRLLLQIARRRLKIGLPRGPT